MKHFRIFAIILLFSFALHYTLLLNDKNGTAMADNINEILTNISTTKKVYAPQYYTKPSKIYGKAKCNDDIVKNIASKQGLRETYAKCVYCQIVDDDGLYMHQKHYVWNPAKENFTLLPDIYYIPKNGIDNDMVQANIQGYQFTTVDGIYFKDNTYYRYIDGSKTFEDIRF